MLLMQLFNLFDAISLLLLTFDDVLLGVCEMRPLLVSEFALKPNFGSTSSVELSHSTPEKANLDSS